MRNPITYFLFLITSLFVFQSQQVAENDRVYYDHQLDYFPKVKSFHTDTNTTIRFAFSGEFKEAIESLCNHIHPDHYILERFSGFTMQTSGISPPELKEHPMWMSVTIDKHGTLEALNISPGNQAADVALEKELFNLFSLSKINPALVNGMPVKCNLFYTIDTTE